MRLLWEQFLRFFEIASGCTIWVEILRYRSALSLQVFAQEDKPY